MKLATFILTAVFLLAGTISALAQGRRTLPRLKVSDNKRFLVQEDGKPFFYLGDTAWELFHRLTREEAAAYLKLRSQQKFTVIQAVALAELDGLTDPNPYGSLPLVDLDPTKPAVTPGADPKNPKQYDYWDHVEYIVDEANRQGLYIGMLPSWGAWLDDGRPGKNKVLNAANAQAYGEFVGKRFGKKGVIWILGGDRSADQTAGIWRAMARGIAIGVNGKEDYKGLVMGFHPPGGATSSRWFHEDEWLSVNMQQTGHGLAAEVRSWERIANDYNKTPVKPVMDAEPLYEDHPLAFRAKDNGYSFDAHVRQRAYWDVFSGAFGHTYGDHSVWQMYAPQREPVNGPLLYWNEAIHRPGAADMQWVRALIESRPFLSRVPDQSIVVNALEGADHVAATRGDGYLFVYSAQGRPFTVTMGKISGDRVKGWWYNPRTGTSMEIGPLDNRGSQDFEPPSQGFGSDWVLVLDDAGKNFKAPGK
ncbi:MAG: glycoside hydrolase family 140 protein [Bryobacteraceae bacterium]|jgi:hypothetical protein